MVLKPELAAQSFKTILIFLAERVDVKKKNEKEKVPFWEIRNFFTSSKVTPS